MNKENQCLPYLKSIWKGIKSFFCIEKERNWDEFEHDHGNEERFSKLAPK